MVFQMNEILQLFLTELLQGNDGNVLQGDWTPIHREHAELGTKGDSRVGAVFTLV